MSGRIIVVIAAFGLAFLKIVAYIVSGVERKAGWRVRLEATSHIATITAVLIGAVWSIILFEVERVGVPVLAVSHACDHVEQRNGRTLLRVHLDVENVGKGVMREGQFSYKAYVYDAAPKTPMPDELVKLDEARFNFNDYTYFSGNKARIANYFEEWVGESVLLGRDPNTPDYKLEPGDRANYVLSFMLHEAVDAVIVCVEYNCVNCSFWWNPGPPKYQWSVYQIRAPSARTP